MAKTSKCKIKKKCVFLWNDAVTTKIDTLTLQDDLPSFSVLVDQDARLAMSYVMNKMFPGLLGDTRSYMIRQQAYEDLAD